MKSHTPPPRPTQVEWDPRRVLLRHDPPWSLTRGPVSVGDGPVEPPNVQTMSRVSVETRTTSRVVSPSDPEAVEGVSDRVGCLGSGHPWCQRPHRWSTGRSSHISHSAMSHGPTSGRLTIAQCSLPSWWKTPPRFGRSIVPVWSSPVRDWERTGREGGVTGQSAAVRLAIGARSPWFKVLSSYLHPGSYWPASQTSCLRRRVPCTLQSPEARNGTDGQGRTSFTGRKSGHAR